MKPIIQTHIKTNTISNMLLQLRKASFEDKTIIKNLMQFYMYDFSEFVNIDLENNGLFAAYKHSDEYWSSGDNNFPYLITKDEKYIGFALVRFIESADPKYFSMAEFFVMRKYRRSGIGKTTAHHVFNLHKGNWEVFQREGNTVAHLFWRKIISEYTNGNFTERFEDGRTIQNFVT